MTHYYVLFLLLIGSLSKSTKVNLVSYSQSLALNTKSTQVPLKHDQQFSCELVFFNVHDNKLIANVTQIDTSIKKITLKLIMPEQQQLSDKTVYKGQSQVLNGTAVFSIDLSGMNRTDNYETIVNINLTYQFQNENKQQFRQVYMLFCESNTDYILKLPIKTILITQGAGLLCILLLPWNVQYRKFLPFSFNIFSVFLYICVLFVALYLQMFIGTAQIIYQLQRYIVFIFQFICILIYSHDLLMIITQRNILAIVVSFLFTFGLLFVDYFVPVISDAWFLNDIISLLVAGAFIKFVIIRKIKTAVWALALMWVFCLLREFAIQFRIQKFQQGLGLRVVPLFLQLPIFSDQVSSIICSAFGSSKIISFGVILNYCKRVDISLSTHFYRVLSSILAVLCVVLQLFINIFVLKDSPTMQMTSVLIFYPLSVILILFFANKRGEWAELWAGSFFDMAVNRSSIPRQISFQDLQAEFGKDLLTNSEVSVANFNQNRNM